MNFVQIKEMIISNPVLMWISIGIIVFVVIMAFVFKEKKLVKKAIYNGIVLAEKEFNSGEGQKKLEFATNYVKEQLPSWLRFIITKKLIITIIEFVLNKTSDIFQLEYDVDIIGNEKEVKTNVDIDTINKNLKAEIEVSKEIKPENTKED